MREKILNDLKETKKLKEKEKLSDIRMLKGDMRLEEINNKKELNDDEIISLIVKQIKTRKESITEFEKGNREDLVNKTKQEIDILQTYLPKQFTEEEVNAEIAKYLMN